MPVLFDIRELTKVYRMGEVEVHALRDVCLMLHEGHSSCLLGPSGSGKSTLLNILGGLDVPTGGHVFYRDTDLTDADETALTAYRRRHVGFVFQFYNLIPSLTRSRNVALVTEIVDAPMPPEEALALVKLQDRLHHLPGAVVRRRATARGHRPRHRQASRRAALRRANRRARHLHRCRRARGAGAGECRTGHDHGRHHTQRGHRVDGRSRHPPGRRPGRSASKIATDKLVAARLVMVRRHGEVVTRLSPLNRKLLRDLWQMKAQALAIAMVVAAGVAMFVMYLSNFASLRADAAELLPAAAICRRVRVAQARPVAGRVEHRGIPGVSAVEPRVVANVTLDLPGMTSPPADASCRSRWIAGRTSTTCSSGADAGSSADARTKCWPAKPSSTRTASSPATACRPSSTDGGGS